MMRKILLIGFAVIVYQYWEIEITFAEEATLSVHHLETPIYVNGNLDEGAWQKATQVKLVWMSDDNREKDDFQTSALIAYDDTALYIAFVNRDPDSSNLIAGLSMLENNAHVPRDDSVGIFIDTDNSDTGFFVVYLNSKNEIYSLWIPAQELVKKIRDGNIPQKLIPVALAYSERSDWNPKGLQTATYIGKDIWIAEIKIPFEDLLTSKPSTKTWNANFVRHIPGWEDIWVTWAKTDQSLYRSSEFGSITFTK